MIVTRLLVANTVLTSFHNPIFVPLLPLFASLFGGFYINIESLPDWLRWVQYLSLMRFAFEGLIVNELADATFTCDDVAPGKVCIETGREQLDRLSFTNSVADVLIMMLGFMCVCHLVAYVILQRNGKKYMSVVEKGGAREGEKWAKGAVVIVKGGEKRV